MNAIQAILAVPLLATAVLGAPVMAQYEPSYAQETRPAAARPFSQAELDQMLAPIALYPDALLSQMLMAATYPLEIVQAARWSRANPDLQGEEAVRAVQDRDWDPSVKSMVAFPQLLARMDERIEWTGRLGEAFVTHEQQVMDTVQELRRRAYEAGNLRSSEEIVVRRESDYIMIDPPASDQVYVPYYDTRVVYGRWWWPQYEPVVWSPWSGYYYTPGYTAFGWGVGVPVGYHFFYGTFDWPRRHVRHSHHRPWYYSSHRWHNGERWRHDHARSHWRRDRHPAWRGEGERRWNDGRREWREGDRWRDGDGRGRGRGDRDGRRDDDGRGDDDGRRDGSGRRAEGWRGQEGRAVPSPTVRSAPVTPSPAQGYQAAPARSGTPLPPRTSIGSTPAPAPVAVPRAGFGRSGDAPPQVAPRAMPAPVERPAPAPRANPAERVAPAPVERSAPAPAREASPPPAREPSSPARENHAPARGRER